MTQPSNQALQTVRGAIKDFADRLDALNAEFLHAIPFSPDMTEAEERICERLEDVRMKHVGLIAEMRAALASAEEPSVPPVAAWRPMPIEPTTEMLKAMWEAMFTDAFDGSQAPMVGAAYDAALAAAPAPEAGHGE